MQTAFIGMGGNVASWAGAPEATLACAAERLAAMGRVRHRSSLYSTEPVGLADQPRFVNAVVELETALEPHMLLHALLGLEQEFGRDRSNGIPNGPRTLDLDLLLYGSVIVNDAELELPHPRLADRAFVLIPLAEIAPELFVPALGKTVESLFNELLRASNAATDSVFPLQSACWSENCA